MHDEAAERTILGAALLDPSSLHQAASVIKAADFYSRGNAVAFEAMLALAEKGRAIDLITLKDELQRRETLNTAGGIERLAGLLDGLPRVQNVEHWAEIVRDKATLRRLRMAGANIEALCVAGGKSADVVASALSEVMAVASDAQGDDGFASPQAAYKQAMIDLDFLMESKGIVGIRTGFAEFDLKTGGLRPEQLLVVAGRPAMGKTAAAVSLADMIAAMGKRVAFFSLEMSREELTNRRIQRRSGVPIGLLRLAPDNVKGELLAKIARVTGGLANDPLYVDATPALTMSQIRARARRLSAEKGGLDLIVVDYLQLITGERTENRQQEVAGIARGLKNLAKELRVPVVALSQLNRDLEKREDKRPMLADLRESGEVEQAADIVMFLYRDCVYHDSAEKTDAEFIVAKHRNGPLFTLPVTYEQSLASFFERKEQAI